MTGPRAAPWAGRGIGLLLALLAAAAAWSASWSWAPLYAAPREYLVPGLFACLVVALTGVLARMLRLPVPIAVLVQLLAGATLLVIWFTGGVAHLPTPSAWEAFADRVVAGSRRVNTEPAPVPARFTGVPVFLALCTAGLATAVDALARGWRRVPLAGLPLLLALTVPISVLDARVRVDVMIATAACFLALLATEHLAVLRSWGRGLEEPRAGAGGHGLAGAVVGIGSIAILGSLLAPSVVPVSSGVFGEGAGAGTGGRRGVALTNPMLDIRRDLIRRTHTPLLQVRTDDPTPSYVQISVLDRFTGNSWRAAERQLPATNRVAGALPPAPGLSPRQPGQERHWQLRLDDGFRTTWLPVPTPTRQVEIAGDWRFDSRTLDIVNAGDADASGGVSYRVEAFDPSYDATTLDEAGTPVGQAVEGMTDLPDDLPPVIARVAREVTRGADTQYRQAVALQDWFSSEGGFRYSLDPAPGSGMALIARFVTVDKVGYCEQFAAAMAVMARTLDIPARVVVGFLRPSGESSAEGRLFTSDDLHAWPELYFAGSGWVRFEPTPTVRTGSTPAYTRQDLRPDQPLPSASPTTQQSASPRPTPAAPSSSEEASEDRAIPTPLPWIAGGLLIGIALCLPRLLRRGRCARRRTDADVASASWAELRATALDHGLGWADGRSPRQALAALRGRVSADPALAAELSWYAGFVERAWYGRAETPEASDVERAWTVVDRWSAEIAGRVSPRTARRARWWPASLFGS